MGSLQTWLLYKLQHALSYVSIEYPLLMILRHDACCVCVAFAVMTQTVAAFVHQMQIVSNSPGLTFVHSYKLLCAGQHGPWCAFWF